jgi:hypothetical protein
MNHSRLLPVLAVAVIVAGVFALTRGEALPEVSRIASHDSSAVAPVLEPTPAQAAPAAPPSAPLVASVAQPGALEAMQAREQASRERLARLEKAWTDDAHDPATSPQVEELLVQTLSAERLAEVRGQPARVSGVHCRASLCRIEAVFPAGRSGSEWGTRLLLELGGTFSGSQMIALPGNEGESSLVIFAQRAPAVTR